jgi:hypothetical protein
MRNAARILFVIAAVMVVGSIVIAVMGVFHAGPLGMAGPGALTAIVGGITMAIPPFVGAAIIWRLDIWLFERGDPR